MIIRNEDTADWLSRTENEAKDDLHEAVNKWIAFCKKVIAIQDSKLWQSKASTWQSYVRATWDIDSSRIRQYKSALPYAEIIVEALPDLSTPETNIRKMKSAGIDADNPDMPRIYKTVIEYAQDNNVPVQQSFFEHAQRVYDEAQVTGGYVDIGEDEIVPIDWEGSTKLAMARSIDEAKMRYRERLNRVGIPVTARRISANQYLIECEDELPETFQFKLWKDKEVEVSEPEHNNFHKAMNEWALKLRKDKQDEQ